MKKVILFLLSLFVFAVCGNAQTVKSLAYNTTNNVTIGPTNTNALVFTNRLNFTNNVRVNDSQTSTNFIYGGVGGVLEVQAINNHAIVARAPNASDATAFYGFSASGASVAKFVQDTNFTSPAITIWRPSTIGNKASPMLLIVDTKTPTNTNTAIQIRADTTEVFTLDFQGKAVSGGSPVMRYRGVYTTTTKPPSPLEGDLIFISNTTNSQPFQVFNGTNWIP
jgi:hypothetical protein